MDLLQGFDDDDGDKDADRLRKPRKTEQPQRKGDDPMYDGKLDRSVNTMTQRKKDESQS